MSQPKGQVPASDGAGPRPPGSSWDWRSSRWRLSTACRRGPRPACLRANRSGLRIRSDQPDGSTMACLPSKNLIYSARVASLARRRAEFGLETNSLAVSMKDVQRRKRLMVEGLHQMHVARTVASGAELITGEGRFVAPRTVEIALNDGGSRRIFGERMFLVLGSRATMPKVPGLAAANPMTHIEALDLDRLPANLIVMGGGYVGLELAQAMRRCGSQVTVIERDSQLASREDPDVGAALLELFHEEGIEVLLGTEIRRVEGRSAESIRIHAKDGQGERIVEGTDLLVATGRTPNTDGIGLEQAGVELKSMAISG